MRLAVLVLVLLARVAHAQVGVVVAGEPVMQAPVMGQVQAWLQAHSHQLIAAPFGMAQTNSFIDCFVMEDMTCARNLFEKDSKAKHVVFVRVDLATGQPRDYAFVAHWFTKGRAPVVAKRTCQQCDDVQLTATIEGLMSGLEKTGGPEMGRLKISAGAEGILVSVDNVAVGQAPIERELTAGDHEVTFSRDGTVVGAKHVTIQAGATVELAIPAPPSPVDQPPTDRPSRTLPVALLAGGAAAAVAGGVFLYYGSLGGPDEPYVYTNANKIGAPLTVAGGAAIIAGAVLWFRAKPASTPTVSLAPGGAQIGWAGTF